MAALWQQTTLIVSFNWQVRLRGGEVNVLPSGVKKCPVHSGFFARFFALKGFRASGQLKCLSRISQKTSLSYVLCRIVVIQPHWRVFKHLLKVLPHHLNHIQVLTLTRPLQSLHFVFLGPSRGGLGSSSCCGTQVSFSWRSRRLTLFLLFFFFGRHQNSWFDLTQQFFQILKQLNLISPQSIFPNVKMFSDKTVRPEEVFCWNSATQAMCAQSGGIMKTDLHWGTWDLQFFGCCCRVLCDFLMSCNFGCTSWKRFHVFVDKGSHCGSWSPKI